MIRFLKKKNWGCLTPLLMRVLNWQPIKRTSGSCASQTCTVPASTCNQKIITLSSSESHPSLSSHSVEPLRSSLVSFRSHLPSLGSLAKMSSIILSSFFLLFSQPRRLPAEEEGRPRFLRTPLFLEADHPPPRPQVFSGSSPIS